MSDTIRKLEAKAADRSLPPEERLRFYEKAANLRATQKEIARQEAANIELQMVKLKKEAERIEEPDYKFPVGGVIFVLAWLAAGFLILPFVVFPLFMKVAEWIRAL